MSFSSLSNLSSRPLPYKNIFWIPSATYPASEGWMVNPNSALLKTNMFSENWWLDSMSDFLSKNGPFFSTRGHIFVHFVRVGKMHSHTLMIADDDLMHPNKQTNISIDCVFRWSNLSLRLTSWMPSSPPLRKRWFPCLVFMGGGGVQEFFREILQSSHTIGSYC